ncbi:hypothetical protein J8M20_24210, partial [Pseudoalteromonas luteoviolacea]|uniref:hypothetical protein n=1 Tax=Pseudoalteromonas luteoviolacea TaxID=43657 RepID=UPI001B360F16
YSFTPQIVPNFLLISFNQTKHFSLLCLSTAFSKRLKCQRKLAGLYPQDSFTGKTIIIRYLNFSNKPYVACMAV